MTKATEDGVISDDEAKKINDSLKDFQNLMSKLEKYEKDKEKSSQMQTFAHFFCSIYTSWRNNSPIFIVTLQQLSKQQL